MAGAEAADTASQTEGAVGAPAARRDRRGLVGPFTTRHLAVGLVVILAAAGTLLAITTPLAGTPRPTTRPLPGASQFVIGPVTEGLRVGDRLPELRGQRADGTPFQLTDLSGNPIRLADLRGHPVWVNFWASWCPPCQQETPVLRDLYNAYRSRGLELVAISVQESNAADVAAYVQRYQLPYRVGADLTGDIFRAYRIYGLPTQFFVDGDGIIRSVVQGPVDYDLGVQNLQLIVPASTGSAGAGGTGASAAP